MRTGHADPEINHEDERFSVAKELGIYREVDSGSTMTTDRIIDRIINNRYVIASLFCLNTSFCLVVHSSRGTPKKRGRKLLRSRLFRS